MRTQLDSGWVSTGKQSLELILELTRSEKLTTCLNVFLHYKTGPFQKFSASSEGRMDSDTLVFCGRNLWREVCIQGVKNCQLSLKIIPTGPVSDIALCQTLPSRGRVQIRNGMSHKHCTLKWWVNHIFMAASMWMSCWDSFSSFWTILSRGKYFNKITSLGFVFHCLV